MKHKKARIKKLLPLIVLLQAFVVNAQPYIVAQYNNPLDFGGSDNLVNTHEFNYRDPGPEGELVTWIFNDVLSNTWNSTKYFSTADDTWYQNIYPGSDFYKPNNFPDQYDYYDTTSSWLQITGELFNNSMGHNTYVRYTNPKDILHYPFTFNTAYTDTFAAYFIDPDDSTRTNRSGTIHVKCDAYGTLYLPFNMPVDNIQRVRLEENYTDSLTASPFTVTTIQHIAYRWYLSGTRHSVMRLEQQYINGQYTDFADYLDSAMVHYFPLIYSSVDETEQTSAKVFFNGYELMIENTGEEPYRIQLYNTAGNLLVDEKTNVNRKQISASGFPSGLYFVKFNEQVKKVMLYR